MEGALVFLIVFWMALWRWRSWGMLGWFTSVYLAVRATGVILEHLDRTSAGGSPWADFPWGAATDAAIDVAFLSLGGAAIVALRGGKFEKKVSEAEIDAELARVRAEAAAREGDRK